MSLIAKNRALFLDRDGVVNVDRHYLYKVEDFELIPGIIDLCGSAQKLGYKLVVITNQSGIARGKYTLDDLQKLHHHMRFLFLQKNISIDLIFYCPHHPDFNGNCLCRKPGNLLYQRAAALLNIDSKTSFSLGDKQRDLDPGKSIGCTTVAVGQEPGLLADIHIDRPDQLIEYLHK